MKIFKVLAMLLVMAIVALPCYGLTITGGSIDVGELDTFIGSESLSNSGDDTEITFLGSNGIYSDLTFTKYESGDPGDPEFIWNLTDSDNVYALEFQELNDPEYFILKIGNIDGYDTHLLFANVDEDGYAVVDLAGNYFPSSVMTAYTSSNDDFNIDKISHISFYAASASPVPEPATMLLFGMGLLGMGFTFRKKIN